MKAVLGLTHISLASFLWDIGKQRDPDQTPPNAASDQGFHCLLTECSIKIGIKMKNTTLQPLKRKLIREEILFGLNGSTHDCFSKCV